jgi:hypothetical protein
VEGDLETVTRRKARREADLAERRGAVSVLEAAVDAMRDRVADLDGRLRELDGLRAFSSRRIEESADRSHRHEEMRLAAAQDAERAASEKDLAASLLDSGGRSLEAAAVARENAATQALRFDALLETARSDAKDRLGKAQRAELEAERVRLEVEELQRRSEAMPGRIADVEAEAQRATADALSARNARDAAVDRYHRARSDLDEAEAARLAVADVETAARTAENEAIASLSEAESAQTRARASWLAQISRLDKAAVEAEVAYEGARARADAEVERRWSEARRSVEASLRVEREGLEEALKGEQRVRGSQ